MCLSIHLLRDICSLCRQHRDTERFPSRTERFELFIGGRTWVRARVRVRVRVRVNIRVRVNVTARVRFTAGNVQSVCHLSQADNGLSCYEYMV